MEQEKKNEDRNGDGDDGALGSVTEHLDMALELLEDLAEEQGIDLNSVETGEEEAETPVVHILSALSMAYVKMAGLWFDRHPDLSENSHREACTHLKLIHPVPVTATASAREFIEIILFYRHPIHFKLDRALRSRREEKDFHIEGIPKDSDGSAKVALIQIDRSICAWNGLLNIFCDQAKEITDILGHLKRIRDLAEKEFPDARAFIRPGFDEQ
jgi:hypothetical protein